MANHQGSEVEKFEAFKEELRAVPDSEVAAGIEAGLDSAAISLRDAILERPIDQDQLVAATYRFGLYAVAKAGLIEDESEIRAPWLTPRWILAARDYLASKVEDSPEEFGSLRAAVFFTENKGLLRTLNTCVNASVEPGGAYDPKSFAAGVVKGRIISPKAQIPATS